MGGDPRKRILGQWDGARDGWGAKLPLKIDEETVEIDASAVRFAVPTFLLRLRAFVEWHLEKGHSVRVKCPSNERVAEYMRRSEIAKGLPEGVFLGLPDLPPAADSDVLIPIRKLREPADVDRLGEKLVPLFESHSDDVAVFTNAMHMATSELCGNAVEHGVNPLGCYVAAQRYNRPFRRTVLALGDFGIGIPRHMRQRFENLAGDRSALREAVKHGVTGTDEKHRGNGFHWVMDAAEQSLMRYATLDIRSGKGQLQQVLYVDGEGLETTTNPAPFKLGTWVTFEIGPLTTV
jgi:anti-sigma regulatory factor (Ser/Thr protein kinase)